MPFNVPYGSLSQIAKDSLVPFKTSLLAFPVPPIRSWARDVGYLVIPLSLCAWPQTFRCFPWSSGICEKSSMTLTRFDLQAIF